MICMSNDVEIISSTNNRDNFRHYRPSGLTLAQKVVLGISASGGFQRISCVTLYVARLYCVFCMCSEYFFFVIKLCCSHYSRLLLLYFSPYEFTLHFYRTPVCSLVGILERHKQLLRLLSANMHLTNKFSLPSRLSPLKGHCIEFKYYADSIYSGVTPPG